MIILAVESAAAIASAALLRDGVLLAEESTDPARKHAETLLPLIKELLDGAGLSLADVDAFAVDIGPGSFTGLRIGVCAVNAMAFALAKPVIAVDSLRILAEPHMDGGARICALMDAGHSASYAAEFHKGRCLVEPCARDTAELLASLPPDTLVERDRTPAAADLARAAWRLRETRVSAAVPLYVQPSQAERLYQKRMEECAHD